VNLWLATLPFWSGFVIFVGVGLAISLVGLLIVNAYFPQIDLIANNLVGGFKFAFLAQVYSALLAFVLIEAGHRYATESALVSSEATTLLYLDRAVAATAGTQAEAFRRNLRVYARLVVSREWAAMAEGDDSPDASQAFLALFSSYVAIKPEEGGAEQANLSLPSQLLLNAMDKRVSRINGASETLAPIIWAVTFIGTAISIAFNWFFGSRTLLTQLVMAALLSGSILAILFLAMALSHPFVGDLRISPTPFEALYAPSP
jgi:Protein of unknown function (DUF4239)